MASRTKPKRIVPKVSADLESFEEALRHAGDRALLVEGAKRAEMLVRERLSEGEFDRVSEFVEFTGRKAKKNFAQRFSEAIAQKIANELRGRFPGILPDKDGGGHESLSGSASGLKKLDVNYSTHRSGLELAISIKTINFADDATGRFTKNVKRVDGELRAEAQDCHGKHRFAVIAVFLFLPVEAASDGRTGISSARHAAKVLTKRTGRVELNGQDSLVELTFVGLYDDRGRLTLCRPEMVPETGLPIESSRVSFADALDEVIRAHERRNLGTS